MFLFPMLMLILPANLLIGPNEDFILYMLPKTFSKTHVNQDISTLKLGNSHSCKTPDLKARCW